MKTRNEKIYAAYLSGENSTTIGKRFGLTKQRVIQIAKELGAPGRVYEPSDGEVGWMICKVEGCGKIVRSRWGTLCNTHYFRGRRKGTTDDPVRRPPMLTNHGYLCQNWKGHPASSKRGLLYEHRKVFFETFGPDRHTCKWCKIPVKWGGCGEGKLHVDHLDGNKTNNASKNLVASCHRCNVKRGLFMSWISTHKDDPVIRALFEQNL